MGSVTITFAFTCPAKKYGQLGEHKKSYVKREYDAQRQQALGIDIVSMGDNAVHAALRRMIGGVGFLKACEPRSPRPIIGDGACDARHVAEAQVVFQPRFHAKRHPIGEKREQPDGDEKHDRCSSFRSVPSAPKGCRIPSSSNGGVEDGQKDKQQQCRKARHDPCARSGQHQCDEAKSSKRTGESRAADETFLFIRHGQTICHQSPHHAPVGSQESFMQQHNKCEQDEAEKGCSGISVDEETGQTVKIKAFLNEAEHFRKKQKLHD